MTSSLGIAVYALTATVLLGQVVQTVAQRKQYRCVPSSGPSAVQPEEPGPGSPRAPAKQSRTPSAVPSTSTAVPRPPRPPKTVRRPQRTTTYATATRPAPPSVTTKPPADSFGLFRLPLRLISGLLASFKHAAGQNATSAFPPLITFNMPLTFSKVQPSYPSRIRANDPPPSDTADPPGPCYHPPPPPDAVDPPDPCYHTPPPPPDAVDPPGPFDPPPSDTADPPGPCDSDDPPIPRDPAPANTPNPVYPVKLLHGDVDDTVGLLCDVLLNKFGYSCADYARDPERITTNAPCENTAAAEHTPCDTWTVVMTPPQTTSTPTDTAPPPPAREPCAPARKPCAPPPARKPCKSGVPHGRRHGAPSKHRPRHDFLDVLKSLISSYDAPSAVTSVNLKQKT